MIYEEGKEEDLEVRGTAECECLVSVSCITFNHGRYLRKALDSFLMQETGFNYEILIHDDASTDDTIEIIKEYHDRYPDIIRPLFEKENQYSRGISNISGVFNFPRARGRYIAMCEGDDYWTDPGKLRKQAAFMETHPEYSLCCHAAAIVPEDGAYRSKSDIRPYTVTGEVAAESFISRKTNIPTASMFFRTAYARELPDWYFECPVGDIPLQLYMLMKGRIYYMDEAMSAYRMGREGSWGRMMDDAEVSARLKTRWEEHFRAMERLYSSFDSDSGGKWHASVEEALRRQRFQIDLKEGRAAAVLDKNNSKFVSELPRTEAALQKLNARAPWIYNMLRSVYKGITASFFY